MNIEDIVIGKDYEYMGKQCKPFVAKDNKVLLLLYVDPEDVKEPDPYKDFVIDEPVMVKDKCIPIWIPRYFAGVTSGGKPLTYYGGCTSWTARGEIKSWDECRRPTEEELQEMKGGAA